jgi:hypothetical protein
MPGEVLLQLETRSRPECWVVTGLPTDDTVRVTVATASSAAARTEVDAGALYDDIAAALRALGGGLAHGACQGKYFGTGTCTADDSAPRDHNVLVVVEDASQDIEPRVLAAFRRFPSHVIIPVVQSGSRSSPSAGITEHLMLGYAPGTMAAVVPEILVSARIGTDAFRLFVSYKHDDCAAAAEGIFHRLAEARFAVFLDRFCGLPGQNFVARINGELFDKSCVLVLETPMVANSTWVQTEVHTARTHRLGLLAVDLPGSAYAFRIASRLDCTSVNGKAPLGRHDGLTTPELDRIVTFVRRNMAKQGARRRRWQRRNLREAVSRSGVTDRGETFLGRRVSNGIRDYHLSLTARPPGAPAFKSSREAASPSERPILFGPLSHQLENDAALTAWLDDVSGVRAFDEATMIPTLHAISGGRL